MNRLRNVRVLLLAVCLCLAAALAMSCSKTKTTANAEEKEKAAATEQSGKKAYEIMEKMLADQPGRPRTTLKVVVPEGSGKDALEAILKDVQAQDPSLKAVIIWAYSSRAELNGPSFTVGKLEWSADGKDFNNTKALTPNPKIDMMPAKVKAGGNKK